MLMTVLYFRSTGRTRHQREQRDSELRIPMRLLQGALWDPKTPDYDYLLSQTHDTERIVREL